MRCAQWSSPRLAGDGAFDLVMGSDGPILLWSPFALASDAVINIQRAGRDGAPNGPTQALALPPDRVAPVEEIAAAAASGVVGMAWVTRAAGGRTAFAARGHEGSFGLLNAEALGSVEAAEGARGRILLAAGEDGEMHVTWRGERSPCQAQAGTCSHYSRRSLASGNTDDRGVIAREMLVPCDVMLVGSMWADGSWYEGVCHRNAAEVAYVFSFRPSISYAEANDVLHGCNSFALSRSRVGAALWAECADGTAVAIRSHQPSDNRTLRAVTRSVRCDAGRPVLVARGQGGDVELPLAAPVDGIAAAVAGLPVGARAIWTGSHIVAAFLDQGRLRLKRGACRSETFEWCADEAKP